MYQRFYESNVGVAYVALIRSRVDSDAFGTEVLAVDGGLFHVGHIPAPGIAHRGYLVDVDTKSCHGSIALSYVGIS